MSTPLQHIPECANHNAMAAEAQLDAWDWTTPQLAAYLQMRELIRQDDGGAQIMLQLVGELSPDWRAKLAGAIAHSLIPT